MIETRGTWTSLIGGVGVKIAEVFDQGQEEYIPGIGNLLMVDGTVTGAQLTVTGKTGVGELESFDDGDDVPLGRRYKTYDTTYVWNNYGKGIQVTKNTIEDRDFQQELDEMKDLSIASNYSQDKSGIQIFNGGFATTATVNRFKLSLYGDAVPTFSTVHPSVVPGASTQSNASSTGIVFSHDNLETAYVAMLQQQTDDGLALSLMGKPTVVLPSNLIKEGEEITSSVLDPSTANNAINVYKNGMKVDMATSIHLDSVNGGSNTAWYLIVPGRTRFVHFVRQSPRLEKDVDILNKVATFTVDARWADGVKDWRRSWGSKGDNAAYSS